MPALGSRSPGQPLIRPALFLLGLPPHWTPSLPPPASRRYPPYAYLAALGYCLISPNYRGSTGYGQAALASLPGRIGTADVADCMDALQAAVALGLADPARAAVVGGSHGGFLAGHLLGQTPPGTFRAGVARNPVTNISAMVGATDIPDWCYVEVLGSEEGRRRCSAAPTPDDMAAMYSASPIAHVDKASGAWGRVPSPHTCGWGCACLQRFVCSASNLVPQKTVLCAATGLPSSTTAKSVSSACPLPTRCPSLPR